MASLCVRYYYFFLLPLSFSWVRYWPSRVRVPYLRCELDNNILNEHDATRRLANAAFLLLIIILYAHSPHHVPEYNKKKKTTQKNIFTTVYLLLLLCIY